MPAPVKKPIGNKSKGNTIPLPKGGAGASLGQTPINQYTPEFKSPALTAGANQYNAGNDNLMGQLDPNNVYQGGYVPQFSGNNIPLPMGGQNPYNQDLYSALQAFGMLGAVSDPNFDPARANMDARFPGGITLEDILNYLPDNYAWLQPEQTTQLQQGIKNPNGGGGGYNIPMWGGGNFSTGGGGGGVNSKGYRSSDLVNWRI